MNILHHKSWHVRNKDNIARVRKDEAKAAEETRQNEMKISRAEKEARINFLRSKVSSKDSTTITSTITLTPKEVSSSSTPVVEPDSQHLNLFSINYTQSKSNKEHEVEKKHEKEKYEKQIGYLTYLGQYQNEDPHLRRWYDVEPKRHDSTKNYSEDDVKDSDKKKFYDPMKLFTKSDKNIKSKSTDGFKKFEEPKCIVESKLARESKTNLIKEQEIAKKLKNKKLKKKSKHKSKSKKEKRSNDDMTKEKSIKEMREKRLKREAAEKLRQENLFKNKK